MRANYRRTLEAARGKYVALCDGDDWWCDEDKLARQVEVMEADEQLGLCYTRSRRVQGEREWLYPAGEMFTDFDNMLFNNTVENSSALARKDLVMRYYAEVRPEEHPEWLTDDAPMWIWFAACSKMVAIDIPMAVHRLLPESVSQSGNYLRRIAFCDSLMDISLWFDERYGAGRHTHKLWRKRMEVALWVLSRDGSTAEYLRRWWGDVGRTPSLLLNVAGYGLLAKRWLRKMGVLKVK
jgi:glycosyltransferase involved in cell wall biosynthesis